MGYVEDFIRRDSLEDTQDLFALIRARVEEDNPRLQALGASYRFTADIGEYTQPGKTKAYPCVTIYKVTGDEREQIGILLEDTIGFFATGDTMSHGSIDRVVPADDCDQYVRGIMGMAMDPAHLEAMKTAVLARARLSQSVPNAVQPGSRTHGWLVAARLSGTAEPVGP